MRSADLDRRTFLARLGLLGAVAGGSLVMPNLAGIAAASTTQELIPLLRQILAEMTRDTFNGLAVFIAPGPDPYSLAQGAPHPAPGGIEARTPEFLITLFDEVVTLPDDLGRAMAGGLAGGLAGGAALGGCTERAVVVSLSHGGAYSLQMAASWPERVTGQVFICPGTPLSPFTPERWEWILHFEEELDIPEFLKQ